MMPIVSVTGWKPGFKTVSFIKLLREGAQSERTLDDAKAKVDGLLKGKSFTLTFQRSDEATAFVQAANDLGAIATLEVASNASS